MAVRFALHEIRGKDYLVEPRTVADIPDADVGELDKAGAVREPTEVELALYERINPKPVEEPAVAFEVPVAKAAARTKPAVKAPDAPQGEADGDL